MNIPWKMVLRIGIPLLVVAGFGISQIGSTAADDLEIGACFELPNGDDAFSSVKDQDCEGPHEAQLYSIALAVLAESDCETRLMPLIENYDLPDDWFVGSIIDEDEKEPVAQCLIGSESGQLVGSLLD